MNADDHLRRLRDDDRWTDDAPPVDVGRRTRSAFPARRSLVPVLATAVTAVLVVLAGGAVLLSSHPAPAGGSPVSASPSSTSRIIPWVAAAPAPTRSSGVDMGVGVGRVPLCSLSQLQVGSSPGGTAMGVWRAGVTLTNRSGTACTLGAADIALQALAAGRYVTLGKTTVEVDAPGGFRLEPGKTAHFWGGLAPCYTNRHFSTEVFEPMYLTVNGQRVRLNGTVPNDFQPLCSGTTGVGGPSTFDQEGDVPAPVSPYAGLRASMTLPAVVRAGEVVDYTVTLSNTTSNTISLAPCPTYDQGYYDAGGGGTKEHSVSTHDVLNCAAMPALEAGQSATFAMRTTIPDGARGTAKISWYVDGDLSVTTLRTIGTK